MTCDVSHATAPAVAVHCTDAHDPLEVFADTLDLPVQIHVVYVSLHANTCCIYVSLHAMRDDER